MVPWNSALGGFAYNWQSRWVGIFAIKTERTQIDFLSDVLLLPSPLWTLKYLITTQVRLMIFRLAAWSDRHTIEKKFINNEHLILHINWWFLRTPIALPNSQRFTVFVKFLYFTEFSKSLFTNRGCSLFTFARCPSFHCFPWYLRPLLLKWKVSFLLHVFI